jgi:RsiW-degrading membrane proteinase PrsW (M82 family)
MNLGRQPAFWLFVLLLLAGLGLVGLEQASYFAAYPGAWFLSILLLASVAIPVGVIIYRIDQFEPEPASLIVIALLWGGVVALSFAAVVNSTFLDFLQQVLPSQQVNAWGAALVAPIDEEFYKGAGLLMIFFMARDEIDGLMDGLVYGAMIGLGFQVVENMQYFIHAAAESGGSGLGAVVGMFFVRVLVAGLYSHMLFTGLLGFGFAYFVTRRGTATWAKRAGILGLFVLASWAAHFVWNSPWFDSLAEGGVGAFITSLVLKGLPFLVLLLLMVIVARRRESQAFARLMVEEVGGEVVTQEEFQVLRSARRRRKTLRRVKRQRGPGAKLLVRRLMREQMNLALFHKKLERPVHPAVEVQRDKIREMKQQLAAIAPRRA